MNYLDKFVHEQKMTRVGEGALPSHVEPETHGVCIGRDPSNIRPQTWVSERTLELLGENTGENLQNPTNDKSNPER